MSSASMLKFGSRMIDRPRAASMLREARAAFAAGSPNAGELIGWAFSVLRDSRQARRLKIDLLLRVANYDSADALIARCIMHGQDHPLIRMRYAQSLLEQGRVAQADVEIRQALRSRPFHRGTLCMAARIAHAMRQPWRAAALMERASQVGPATDELHGAFVESLLACGLVHYAAAQLKRLSHAVPALEARVLRAQGRTLDAIEMLEGGIIAATSSAALNSCMRELIEALEQTGDASRLRDVVQRHGADLDDSTAAQAALALIGHGDFGHAMELLAPRRTGALVPRASLRALLVAHCLEGRRADAQAALACLQANSFRRAYPMAAGTDMRVEDAEDRAAMAKTWLRGLLGRLIAAPAHNFELNADPSTSVLQRLLQVAESVFDRQARQAKADASDLASIQRHRAVCLAAMGRVDEARAALGRALALSENGSDRGSALEPPSAAPLRRAA